MEEMREPPKASNPDARPPAAPHAIRYTKEPLPVYRYVPGRSPHPRRHPTGHSYRLPEPVVAPWTEGDWNELYPWLRAVDLFNARFWWESHEQLEALWKSAGKTTASGRFVRGILKVAAACLHRELANETSSRKQCEAGMQLVGDVLTSERTDSYMGLDARRWLASLRAWLTDNGRPDVPPIVLAGLADVQTRR